MPKKKSNAKRGKNAKVGKTNSGCHKCGRSFEALPFRCKFCGMAFCGKHRLPEDHACVGLEIRKEELKERISRGGKIIYEPRVKKEVRVKFDEPDVGAGHIPDRAMKNLTDPLLKSPMAVIGIAVAVIVIIAFIITFLLAIF